ncbi:SDR family oxidoreductase [Rhodovulum imhoffii]|nr:SDR family oxidoreductase [Rhodovulum imhoffii]MBK5932639.1 NAD(P)-dependent oxidoreductase [Rhodovulum imhoffii]
MTKTLLSFGHGYSAQALGRKLGAEWRIVGTTRSPEKAGVLRDQGVAAVIWPGTDLRPLLGEATHVLSSVPPGSGGDPVVAALAADLARAPRLEWAGYLSTTGVYGNQDGGWVDETAPLTPSSPRGRARVGAEAAWVALGLPLHIFRLAGIYGPGRSPLTRVASGRAQRIIKPGQVFCRIHVEDIANVLAASIARPAPGTVYNVADDLPAPPQDVLEEAARLLGVAPPPEVPFDKAAMSPMSRSFYAESRRVSNRRIREDLGVALTYPDYRAGLWALAHANGT